MVSIGSLVGYVVLDDKLSPALKVAAANVASFSKTTSDSLKKIGENAQRAGQAMLPISAAISGVGGVSLKMFADFESGMNRVRAVTGATDNEMAQLTEQAKFLGATTVYTARQAADAMGFLGLAGFNTTEIIQAMPGALQLAASAQMEVAEAADITAKVMRGYGLAATDGARINDTLVKSFTKANTDLKQLGEAFKMAGPVAHVAGLQFEETSAALALMADAGFQGSLGGTALRGAIARLSGAVPAVTKELKQLGVEAIDPTTGKMKPMVDVLQQLEVASLDTGELMRIFGQRAGPGMAALLERGSAELRRFTTMLEDAGGTAERIQKIQLQGLKGEWVLMTSAMEGAAISMGASMAPAATKAVGFLTGIATTLQNDVVPAFDALPQIVKVAIGGTIGIVAAAAPVLIAFGAATKAAGFALEGLGISAGRAAAGFGLLGKSVAVVGAALVSWQVGKSIADTKLFGEEQMSLGESFSYGLLKIQQWTGFLQASDADIENSVLAQRNLGKAVAETAAAYEFVGPEIDDATLAVLEHEAQQKAAIDMTTRFKTEMANTKAEVAALTDVQREAIRTAIDMGMAHQEIAGGLQIAEGTVKAYATGLAEADKQTEKFIETSLKSREAVEELTAELKSGQTALESTDIDARLAGIDEWFTKEVNAITSTGEAYKEHYAALAALRDQKKQAELTDIETMNNSSREALERQAEIARNTYSDMLGSGLTFSREVLETQRQKVRDLEDAVRGYGSAWQETGDMGVQAAERIVTGFDHLSETVDETLRRVKGVKEAMDEIYSFDIQALTRQQQDALNRQNAMTFELQQDPNAGLKRKLEQLEDLEGTYAPKDNAQYRRMVEDQALLAQLRAMNLESAPGVHEVQQRAIGTTPSGGYLPGTDIPSSSNSSGSGGGGVVLNNYINGTGEQVARIVEDQLMRTLRAGRQFGVA